MHAVILGIVSMKMGLIKELNLLKNVAFDKIKLILFLL